MSLPLNDYLRPEPAVPSAQAAALTPARARYRADIDGLRALAVVAVILTHARIPGFTGGFIGVDIFFVISGYLIYGDLAKRSGEGRLSFLGFYGRRMRRTLPALYLVAAVTLGLAVGLMMPGDLDAMARSLVATILLVPNIFFFTETGYFDAVAASKPLLHSWSLGVEEQFYLLAPLLPLALRRLSWGGRRLALFALFLAALVGTIALRHLSEAAAFYLMPARIFEFLVGAMLVEGLVPRVRRAWIAEFVSALAVAAIALSVVLFGDAVPHPGLATLLPCFATAAIIHVGTSRRTLAASALGLPPIAFVGLVSYSLYLWHWPMLVLARYADVPETPAVMVLGAALLFGVSVLSWRYLETPFRRPGSRLRERAPLILPAAATVLMASCLAIVSLHGLPGRFPPDVASVSAYYAYRDQKPFREGQCFITSKDRADAYDRATCLKLDPTRANVLLIGDSHAAHLWTGLRDAWPNVNFLQATASGCKPVVGTRGAARCTAMMSEMLDRFIPDHRLDGVIISALWDEADIAPLAATIAALGPHVGSVVVFGPMPRYNEPVATLVAKAMLRHDLDAVADHRLPGIPQLDGEMRQAIAPLATFVSPYEILCPADKCRVLATAGAPMQFDYHHLTPLGVDVMMAQVKSRLPRLFEK